MGQKDNKSIAKFNKNIYNMDKLCQTKGCKI